jgi:hypothetical protein
MKMEQKVINYSHIFLCTEFEFVTATLTLTSRMTYDTTNNGKLKMFGNVFLNPKGADYMNTLQILLCPDQVVHFTSTLPVEVIDIEASIPYSSPHQCELDLSCEYTCVDKSSLPTLCGALLSQSLCDHNFGYLDSDFVRSDPSNVPFEFKNNCVDLIFDEEAIFKRVRSRP